MRIPRVSFSEVVHLVEVAAVVGAAVFAGFQLRALQLQSSANFMLRLNQEFHSPAYEELSDALDSDPAAPILKKQKAGGRFTVHQLDWYLAEYETLDDLYQSDLITCRMIYNEFSYDLEKAYKNKDVMAEVVKERKGDTSLWQGFLKLGKKFDDGYHCQ